MACGCSSSKGGAAQAREAASTSLGADRFSTQAATKHAHQCSCGGSCGCGCSGSVKHAGGMGLHPPIHEWGQSKVVDPERGGKQSPIGGLDVDLIGPIPIQVPPASVICCAPPHEELRPKYSFWDCFAYLAQHFPDGKLAPLALEPPQATSGREESKLPRRRGAWPRLALDRSSGRSRSAPIEVPANAAARCFDTMTAVFARFATAPLCPQPQHEQMKSGDGKGEPGGAGGHSGGGGGAVYEPCHCVCTCPDVWGPFGPPDELAGGAGNGGDRESELLVPPQYPMPGFDPFPPQPAPGDDAGLRHGGSPRRPESPWPPPIPPIPPFPVGEGWPPSDPNPGGSARGTLVPDLSPHENLWRDGDCSWCGPVRSRMGSQSATDPALRESSQYVVGHDASLPGIGEALHPPTLSDLSGRVASSSPTAPAPIARSVGPPSHFVSGIPTIGPQGADRG